MVTHYRSFEINFSLYTAYISLCDKQNCLSHYVSTMDHLLNTMISKELLYLGEAIPWKSRKLVIVVSFT